MTNERIAFFEAILEKSRSAFSPIYAQELLDEIKRLQYQPPVAPIQGDQFNGGHA